MYEDPSSGDEWEWIPTSAASGESGASGSDSVPAETGGTSGGGVWVPVIDEELIRAQQSAYGETGQIGESGHQGGNVNVNVNVGGSGSRSVGGGADSPVNGSSSEVLFGELPGDGTGSSSTSTSASPSASAIANTTADTTTKKPLSGKPPKLRQARPITDVYVSNLPPTTTKTQLAELFSRAGLLMTTAAEGGDDEEVEPKIKMYKDATTGEFKGDALISYFKPASVDLAIKLFDDTPLEFGTGQGNMRVSKAEFATKSREEEKVKKENEELVKQRKEREEKKRKEREGEEDEERVVGAAKKKGAEKKKLSEDQKRAAKRVRMLQR